MKILYLFLIVFVWIYSSCAIFKPKANKTEIQTTAVEPVNLSKSTESTTPPKTYYNKHSKFTTAAGIIRSTEQIYYGAQEDILRHFANMDIRKNINRDTYTKFPIASFYSETAISIPEDKKEKAKSLYKPLIDTIFSNATLLPELHFEILVLGYTDETPIEEDSVLYKDILARSLKETLSLKEYYLSLSYFRAKEIGTMISNLIQEQKNVFKKYDKLIIDIIQEGRGTEFPDSKRSYQTIDDKRRIAKVYWKIVNQ